MDVDVHSKYYFDNISDQRSVHTSLLRSRYIITLLHVISFSISIQVAFQYQIFPVNYISNPHVHPDLKLAMAPPTIVLHQNTASMVTPLCLEPHLLSYLQAVLQYFMKYQHLIIDILSV